VRVVMAPVYGDSYRSVSCCKPDDQAQEVLMSGGSTSMVFTETMMVENKKMQVGF